MNWQDNITRWRSLPPEENRAARAAAGGTAGRGCPEGETSGRRERIKLRRRWEAGKVRLYKGRGCANCNNTGYRGRVGLFEVMEISDELRELILSGASAMELRRKAMEEGMITLRLSGLQKLRDGQTSVEEVVRETVL